METTVPRRRYKSSNLFLVRFWIRDSGAEAIDIEWGGKVQRVVDGESHDFNSLQELSDLLVAMLSNNGRR